jgi:WD40 repeat protein
VPAGKVIQEYKAHQRRVWGVAFSPDGRTIVSCGEDGKTRFQPLGGNDHFVLDSPGAKVMSLAYCGPEHLATGGSDNLVRIWDVSRRAQVAELAGHTGSVVTLAYGGNVLISAGYDTTVRVWTSNSNLVRGSTTPSDRVGSRWEPRSRAQQ